MAKKASKGKDKKLHRQEETKRLLEVRHHIHKLNQETDLLMEYQAFQSYDRNGLLAKLHFSTGMTLSDETHAWAYELCKANMEEMYRPVWGWRAEEKRMELRDPAARFLIATQQPKQLSSLDIQAYQERMGYVHWRFEEDEGRPIMYIMEVQLAQPCQGKGLGKFLVKLLELVARRSGLVKIMLTVMHANMAGQALYKRLGFVVDDSSPSLHNPLGDAGYEIMSKLLITKDTSKHA
ncbi:hypothetical protein WJX74_006614 [Apatococcus lobatus]